jgi:KaiC/GvpD/RAD55 family RecA-like ATPase
VPEPGAVAPAPEPRVSTGNPALDSMLEGGLVARRPYLIVGASGTGKSTLALQFLCEGVRRGERVLLVTVEEPPNECRLNHRGLYPELDQVEVFDAIPDIMRYERVPFKDIASVRSAIPFKSVPSRIRRTPELTSVEVTITALEQMLRSEVTRKGYTRIVVDSLTALQYFCMKGFEPVAGAQTFLRFLSDLQVTTVLTVESPLEDVDTAERILARGEIRLFRWELEGLTVRAIGVEKFRGSSHDVRLHPYRIGPHGIDVNLSVTISRDTRQIVQLPLVVEAARAPVSPLVSLEEEVRDFVLIGAPLGPLRDALTAALAASGRGDRAAAERSLADADALTKDLAAWVKDAAGDSVPIGPGAGDAYQRIRTRAESIRLGVPPTLFPELPVLREEVARVLSLIPPSVAPAAEPVPAAAPPARAPPKEVARPKASRSVEPAAPEAPLVVPPPPPPPPPPEPVPEVLAAKPEVGTVSASGTPTPSLPPAPPPAPPPPPPTATPPPAVPTPAADHPSPVVSGAPRSRLRGEPPPLPVIAPAREAAPAAVPTPAPATGPPPAPSPAPTPIPAIGAPSVPDPPAPVPEAVTAPSTRKKKRGPAARRKPVSEPATGEPGPSAEAVGSVPVPPSSPPLPSPEVPVTGEGKVPAAKPKRRAPRKRKAPTVVAATAGEIPSEGLGSPPPVPTPPTEAPPKDGAP